jgi:hypothetical protein
MPEGNSTCEEMHLKFSIVIVRPMLSILQMYK